VVVDLDGDVDLVGEVLTGELNPDATAGEPCR